MVHFFSERIKGTDRTQVLAKGFTIEELLRPEILEELRAKFADSKEVHPVSVKFFVMEKEKPKEQEGEFKKGQSLTIQFTTPDFVELSHPGPAHIRDKVVVITSNRNATLEKFLE